MLPAVRDALAAKGIDHIRLSRRPGAERDLAQGAAADGVQTIIALGGDGTWGNVARGILDSGRDVRLAIIAAGTGNDFGHALGLPTNDARAMVEIALSGKDVRVDVGLVEGMYFLNVAGFGVETAVLESLGRVPLLRGRFLYFITALPHLLTFRAVHARLTFDGEPQAEGASFLALIASNGPRFGGGFRIAPDAKVTDGMLDFTSVHDANVLRRASLLARARRGTHVGQLEVSARRAQRIRLTFDAPPMIDADGELLRARSNEVEVRCVPQALRVAVG